MGMTAIEIERQEIFVRDGFTCIFAQFGMCRSAGLDIHFLSPRLPAAMYFRLEQNRSPIARLTLEHVHGRDQGDPTVTERWNVLATACQMCNQGKTQKMQEAEEQYLSQFDVHGTERFEAALARRYQEWSDAKESRKLVRRTFSRMRREGKKARKVSRHDWAKDLPSTGLAQS